MSRRVPQKFDCGQCNRLARYNPETLLCVYCGKSQRGCLCGDRIIRGYTKAGHWLQEHRKYCHSKEVQG